MPYTITKPNADQFDRLVDGVTRYSAGQSKAFLDATYQAILNGKNTTDVFRKWWPLSNDGTDTRYERLCRFARMMAAAWEDKTYTLRWYQDTVSGSPVMTPLDDLAGRSAAQLCTEATEPVADWADEDPMTWYVRANALSLADGTMNIVAVEGVDAEFDLYGNTAPVYTFCLALWYREWDDGDYHYRSWATGQRGGFRPYAGDIDPTNKKRDLTWHPTFPGGYDSSGRLSSGYGQKPYNRKSGNQGIVSARTVTAYEGLWNDTDSLWILHMWQLRHFNLENSDICNGCQSYNFQYTVAAAENGVKRVLLSSANAANIQVGSNVMVGTHPSGTNTDRNTAANYNLADNATVLSKEDVTVGGNSYVALNLDITSTIDVPATGYVSTAPWSAGNTELLPGHKDGACYSLTAGRNPLRVQGVEVMDGAYTIGLDPLYNVSNYANNKGDYAVYECRDSEKLSSNGSITSDYEDTGIRFLQVAYAWNYVKKFVQTAKGILFPAKFDGSSSTYYKSGFTGTASAGVRCPWRFGVLHGFAYCGLGCANGNGTPGHAYWNGRPRLCGSGKKRGEWPT